MRRASATVTLPGVRIADAETLWYDTTRWSSFIEGFKHVERIEGDWPAAGSRIIWQSVPDGRGRVSEHVTSYVQREGQSSESPTRASAGARASRSPRCRARTTSAGRR